MVTPIRSRLVAGSLLAALLIGACSGGGAGPAADLSVASRADVDRVETVALQQAEEPRKVIYTSSMTVRVGDVGQAIRQAVALVRDAGGVLFAQDSEFQGPKETQLTLKVPPDRFEETLDALAGLGRTLQRELVARDVTEEVVDLEGRLKSGQASAERLRTLLAEAASAQDLVAVEGELAKREGEIESLAGRLRVLSSQVDLATITLRLTERADLQVSEDVPGFLAALRSGWVALLNVLQVVVASVGFVAPFVPFVAFSWWMVRRYRRRHPRPPRGRGPIPSPSPVPVGPPGG